jgi:hypothetical protein
MLYGWQSGSDASVVRDFARIIQRDIEINADQCAFAFE